MITQVAPAPGCNHNIFRESMFGGQAPEYTYVRPRLVCTFPFIKLVNLLNTSPVLLLDTHCLNTRLPRRNDGEATLNVEVSVAVTRIHNLLAVIGKGDCRLVELLVNHVELLLFDGIKVGVVLCSCSPLAEETIPTGQTKNDETCAYIDSWLESWPKTA